MAGFPEGAQALLEQLEDQPPLVPDELTQYLMRRTGQDCKDPRVVRLVSLAGQRFIAAVVHDSLQLCKARLGSTTKRQLKQAGYKDRRVLTSDDLSKALREYGVNLRQAPYYVDTVKKEEGAKK
mmetsp:Transcript_15972/g.34509  ORF Transcript_15972/g.34509 Transcript_15972/m.34509 type:complete len:124 (-) Transcript_15972:1088-1459(-)|eukprot:CAMPEP_0202922868 /NCGR_PEP_ID=MMETSP1392-20130828/78150_1 /ASSEMBLY_ACC=CAM_ASM_000868 /TAXON_ID=225041 /ORGANISM="Chlamydomonas chlamydogama, Strain SAG 11-48b" /LENGTH=123 /DNA_ID=CAMNT_0049616521 /DNA_START=132 /DNA_END=503 /DNA_ORIENTATION=+